MKKMIKTENGNVHINGNMAELATDLTAAVHSLHESFSKRIGSDNSKKLLMESVNLAFLSEKELEAKHEQLKAELLMKIFGRMV